MYCGDTHEPALGFCPCGTVRGSQYPGHLAEIRPPERKGIPTITPKMRERLEMPAEKPSPNVGIPRQVPTSAQLSPGLILGDIHAPYHSKEAWSLAMQVARDIKPEWIVTIGDFADFYAVSDHDKAPERANRFDEELEVVEGLLDELGSLGAHDLIYVEGNHEDRLRRFLMKNPALARVVTTEKLLRLKERGWEFVPYKRHIRRGAIHYTHDVGASGRNAVFRALDTYQHSVVTGHSHRLLYAVEGSAVGECKVSVSFGWMGDVEQVEYMTLAKARKDWALGFGIGYSDASSGFTYLVPVPVVHGTCMVNGKLYRAAV
jgi:predicted phosphodiesterase